MFFEKPHEAWRLHNLSLVPRARAEESFRRFEREHPDAMVVMTSPERSRVETPQRQADPLRPQTKEQPHEGGDPTDDKPAASEESTGITAPEHGDWVVAWDEQLDQRADNLHFAGREANGRRTASFHFTAAPGKYSFPSGEIVIEFPGGQPGDDEPTVRSATYYASEDDVVRWPAR